MHLVTANSKFMFACQEIIHYNAKHSKQQDKKYVKIIKTANTYQNCVEGQTE